MTRLPVHTFSVLATAALVVASVASASPSEAATPATHRQTMAMEMADLGGEFIGFTAQLDKIDGRSTRALQAAVDVLRGANDAIGFEFVKITGLSDKNHNGLDDDATLKLRVLDNVATLTLHKNGTYTVTDAGFVFHNRRLVLKESAQSFDRALRLVAAHGEDSWDMSGFTFLKGEMPTGVRVVSDYDGNHDGYDDDGRLTFLAKNKAVTLTIGNTGTQIGKVSYGPTWKTKAPRRNHRPAAPPQHSVPAPADSNAAVRSLPGKSRPAVDAFDSFRRVFASATAP